MLERTVGAWKGRWVQASNQVAVRRVIVSPLARVAMLVEQPVKLLADLACYHEFTTCGQTGVERPVVQEVLLAEALLVTAI
jgi:hypothetical protein